MRLVEVGLELPEAPLPVDPYVLGCWLGGEHAGNAAMATPKSDRSHFSWEFQRAGYRLEHPAGLPGKAHHRIPVQYLRASFKQRLGLLQGIMDMAGRLRDAPGGRVELCLLNGDVAAQARELVCSLGHHPGPVGTCSVALKAGLDAWFSSWYRSYVGLDGLRSYSSSSPSEYCAYMSVGGAFATCPFHNEIDR